jgi:hypothetical protein
MTGATTTLTRTDLSPEEQSTPIMQKPIIRDLTATDEKSGLDGPYVKKAVVKDTDLQF